MIVRMTAQIDSEELEREIEKVLRAAATGKGAHPGCLTAYQLLRRLPVPVRDALVAAYGTPGKGATKHYSAASRVATAARKFLVGYLDAGDLSFEVDPDEQAVEGGYPLIGLYSIGSLIAS